MKNYSKKILCFISLMVFSISMTHPVQAVWGAGDVVSDFGVIPQEVAQTIGQVTEIVNMVQGVLKEFGLDVIIYKLAQQASQKLIAKVLNHQSGGAGGGEFEYNFVDNFQKHFTNINDQEFAKFTKYLDSDSSNPYSKYISRALVENHAKNGNPLGEFSLDKIPGVDWEQASTNIDSAGISGWSFYSKLANPVNTPIGSSMIAREQLTNQIDEKVEVAKTELTSSGFKPDKGSKCTSSADQYANTNDNGDGSVTLKPECTSSDVKTPSSVGEDQSNQGTKEAFERLRNSDELGKILMNTISQIVTGLIKKGFSGLNSDGGAATRLYGGPKDLSKLLNNQSASWSSAPQELVDLRADIDTGIEKTVLEIKFINDAIELIKAPVVGEVCDESNTNCEKGIVMQLEQCVPGPDTGYELRLQDYVLAQLEDTQQSASKDNKRGESNTRAMAIITRLSKQASEEVKVITSNPFLNIPGAVEMRASLREFYKLSSQFHGLIDTTILKRQTLNSLQTVRSTVLSYGHGLTLFDFQWDILSGAQKVQLYTTVTNTLKNRVDTAPAGTVDPDDISNLANLQSDLPLDDVNTPDTNERDAEQKKRVLDAQWSDWENIMGKEEMETKKNQLYAQYISLGRDISDSSTVQNRKIKTESARHQIQELKKILSDCRTIRAYAQTSTSAGTTTFPQVVINTLSTDRIKDVASGPSIFNYATNGQDYNELNRRILEEQESLPELGGNSANELQVALPRTPQELIAQDTAGELYCRLTWYHLRYWTPYGATPDTTKLMGDPIGCSSSDRWRTERLGDGGNDLGLPRWPKARWYYTNAAEILFNMSDQ